MKLEVGKTYKRRNGPDVKIVKVHLDYWFYDEMGDSYEPDGKNYHSSFSDIIEEVGELETFRKAYGFIQARQDKVADEIRKEWRK